MFHLGLRCICMRVPGIYLVLLYIFVGLAQDFEYQRRLLSLGVGGPLVGRWWAAPSRAPPRRRGARVVQMAVDPRVEPVCWGAGGREGGL